MVKTWFNAKDIPELVKRSHRILWTDFDGTLKLDIVRFADFWLSDFESCTENQVIMSVQTSTFGGFRFFDKNNHELKLKFFGGLRVV